MTSAVAASGGELQAPSLRRRFACMVYEGLLLFGVGLLCGALGTAALKLASGAPHEASSVLILQVIGIGVYGAYFVWFWSARGQTLAMQTWHIKLINARGTNVSVPHALLRYAACAVWLVPPVVVARLNHWSAVTEMLAVVAWIVVYALSSRLHPQRQFWHDVLCGTRQISTQPAKAVAA
ncbi:MAG: RDD family protein [Rhizobacter sp.]